ncbi:MAG: FtsX-like permease family protein [Deltaproteobacteria bacterium]|nr:FtsX-like permease family protein [Deltaproteobacteria bacterium]
MKLQDIALLNLKRRKGKSAFVLAGLMVGVATLVALVSLAEGLADQVHQKLEKFGANILITPESSELALNYGGMNLGGLSLETKEISQADLAGLAHIKSAADVAAVGPVVLGEVEVNSRPVLLAGVDFRQTALLKPWWKLDGVLPVSGQFLAGSEAARVLKLRLGDQRQIKGRNLLLSGILEPNSTQDDNLLFMPLAAAQELLGKEGVVSMVEVAAPGKDHPVADMVRQISQVLPGAKVVAIQSVVKGRIDTLNHFRNFSLGISALVIVLASLVVLVTMMMSVRERTVEIGVFRAIGFRKSHVMQVVLTEAFLLSLLAGVLGCLLGLGAASLVMPLFSQGETASLLVDPWLLGAGLLLALVAGQVASLYPAWLAAQQDPSEALRAL